jgi:hypothetical protein
VLADDPVRDALIKRADSLFWGLIWSTVFLLVGAIMEEVHLLNRLPTHAVNTRTRVRTPRRWIILSKAVYGWVAIVFVVGGIGGEGIFEFLAARAEDRVRAYDEQHLSETIAQAGAAKDSAEIVRKDAEQLQKDVEDEELRRATLETEFDKYEPRLTLLRWHRLDIAKRLKRFSGQRFTIVNAYAEVNESEGGRTSSELAVLLQDVVGWTNNIPTHGAASHA